MKDALATNILSHVPVSNLKIIIIKHWLIITNNIVNIYYRS